MSPGVTVVTRMPWGASFGPDRVGQPGERELAGAVGREVRHGDQSPDRADVDDPAETAPAHFRHHLEHQVERPPEVGGHGVLEVLVLHVLERPDLDHPRAIDQHIDRPAGAQDLRHGRPHVRLAADIAGHREHFRPLFLLEQPPGAVQLALVPGHEHQPRPLGGKLAGKHEAEAAGAAGDDDDPAAEVDGVAGTRQPGAEHGSAGAESQGEGEPSTSGRAACRGATCGCGVQGHDEC